MCIQLGVAEQALVDPVIALVIAAVIAGAWTVVCATAAESEAVLWLVATGLPCASEVVVVAIAAGSKPPDWELVESVPPHYH